MKRELTLSVSVAAVSLTTAALCHAFFPGAGAILKPLLWPALILPFVTRARFALPTAAVVPALSAAINGMPTLPVTLLLMGGATLLAGLLTSARHFCVCHLAAFRKI